MMQYIWQFLYSWIASPLMWIGVQAAAFKNRNLKDGLAGRKGIWKRLAAQIARRDPDTPLIWFHVASAGEFLQAQPVLERCLQHGFECALTVTSVNGYKWLQRTHFPEGQRPVAIEYLPLDSRRNMRRLLTLLRPSLIVYVKYDLWPNLVWEAHKAGIPQYLISGILQSRSKRLTSRLGKSFYRAIYDCLTGIFTVTDDDRQRFRVTNPEHPQIETLGDTGFDSVLDRKRKLPPPRLPDYIQEKFIVIAGSSWPPDEECFFPGLREALERYPDLLVMIVPHEPTEEHLAHSERFFQDKRIERLTRLQPNPRQPPRIILGDTVGILSSLYAVGTLAYVGGAFTTGVHNVMEPCAMGLPVVFGPKYENSPIAIDLVKQKLAFVVRTSEEFRAILFDLLEDRATCRRLGKQAIELIESQAGVADRCFNLITQNISSKTQSDAIL